ncbi:DUF6709 family protein [Anaerocolumna sp.]|uniref:DUF6709 family protein n=1 Tax=Anaerocolumna sp. TaxID=2041569 RepID=UPI0028AA99D1|nr:DUF6709 family protein [Anaerocolumna sp.]
MLQSLKKQSIKQSRKIIGFSIGAMILILILFGASFIKSFKGPVDLNSLSPDEIPNAYVEYDVALIYDVFAEEYTEYKDGRQESTDMYYVIPLSQDKLFALHVDKENFYTANKLYEDSYDYLTQATVDFPTTWKVKGTINKLEEKPLEYYNSYFLEAAGFTQEDIEAYTMPYVLEVNYIGKYDSFMINIAFIVFIILLACVLIILFQGLTGMFTNPIKKYIKKHKDSITIEKMEADYLNGKSVDNVKVGQIWTFFFNGLRAQVVKNDDLIWIYRQERTHRFYGFKVYQMKSLMMFTKDKKKHIAALKNAYDIDDIIEIISQDHPHIVTGYSDELAKCFKKDYETFVKIPYSNESNTVGNEESATTTEQENN